MTEKCSVCYKTEVLAPCVICAACRQQRRDDRKSLIKKTWNGEETKWDKLRPPKRFWGATWDTLTASLQQKIKPLIDEDMELLTLVGPAGAGKSWAAWATVSAFLVDHTGWNGPRYITWFDLNEAARNSRLYGDTGEANRDYLHTLATCDLLVIDEFATAKPYEAEFMAVMAVIHARFDNCRPTILITTKSEAELMASVGEAMVSRINSGIIIKMQGKDRRLRR
jgi:DNA replication protein DnaC